MAPVKKTTEAIRLRWIHFIKFYPPTSLLTDFGLRPGRLFFRKAFTRVFPDRGPAGKSVGFSQTVFVLYYIPRKYILVAIIVGLRKSVIMALNNHVLPYVIQNVSILAHIR